MKFKDQVVLITGASSGIGKQLAIDLAARGSSHPALALHPSIRDLNGRYSGNRIPPIHPDRQALSKGLP